MKCKKIGSRNNNNNKNLHTTEPCEYVRVNVFVLQLRCILFEREFLRVFGARSGVGGQCGRRTICRLNGSWDGIYGVGGWVDTWVVKGLDGMMVGGWKEGRIMERLRWVGEYAALQGELFDISSALCFEGNYCLILLTSRF
jgi:hypothetical protein